MDSQKHEVARIIEFNKHTDEFGTIFIADQELPFDVRRVLWIKDIKDGRGEKAQKECAQIYVAVQGTMVGHVMDGNWKHFILNKQSEGLYLPPMTWREIENATSDAILLVLCSHPYDPSDKIWDYDLFLRIWRSQNEHGLGL